MHCNTLLTAYLFLTTALGAAVGGDKTTSTKVSCLTQMGTKSARHIPTSRSTSTQNLPPLTITKTTRSTVKVTPAPKTITVTKYNIVRTTTTLKTVTKGFTTTLTETDTVTSTDIQSITETSTQVESTTNTETFTAPTPAGFRPAADTAGEPRPVRQIAPRGAEKLDHNEPDWCEVNKFPQSVQCKVVLQVKKISTTTVQRPAVTVTLPRPISLTTKTATITKTDVRFIGKVSSTATITSSTTITTVALSTITAYTTTTSTSTATATTTIYPLCSGANLLSTYNGQQVSGGTGDPDGSGSISSYYGAATTVDSCCAACFNSGIRNDCQGFFFGSGTCLLVYPPASAAGTCAAHGSRFNTGGFFPYTVGNGPCGTFHAT